MPNDNVLTDSDVFTLIGHAELLRGQGEADMPAWCLGLAHRIALGIDEALAARVEALATKHEQTATRPGQPEPNYLCDTGRTIEEVCGLPEPRAEVTDWQPIETVPKDGTEVVLLFADEVTLLGKTRPRVRAAAWLVDWTIPYRRDNPPTHWMPLPAAPFDAARAGEKQ